METQMLATARRRALMLSIVLILSMSTIAGPTPKTSGTFSSLKFNQAGGDLLGYEVRIVPTKRGLRAVVQSAEGEAGDVYVVAVTQNSDEVAFDVPLDGEKPARFEGRLSAGGLKGRISFPSGSAEEVFLRRTTSYWDR